MLFVVAFTVTLFFRSFAVFVPVLQMISSSVRFAFSLFSNFPSLIFHRKVDWSLFSVRFYARRSRSVASLRFSFFVIGWKTPCLFSSVIRFCRSRFVILDCLSLLSSGLLSRFLIDRVCNVSQRRLVSFVLARTRRRMRRAAGYYSKIVRFVNFDHFYCRWRSWCRQCICLSKEISDRKRVLNEMFLAMLADIEWFEKVNALLCALTQRLYTYAGMLYRKTIEWRSSRSRIYGVSETESLTTFSLSENFDSKRFVQRFFDAEKIMWRRHCDSNEIFDKLCYSIYLIVY